MIRCVFFDRDGVVNRSPGEGLYVTRWDEFFLEPDIVPVLRVAAERGFAAILVTNQRAVARGLMTMETLDDIHRRLRETLRAEYGVDFLDIMVCPHGEGVCECRKPKPGLLLAAAARHKIDLAASWMVGDRERDVEAGRRAGCRTVLVKPGLEPTAADFRVPDLRALATLFQARLGADKAQE